MRLSQRPSSPLPTNPQSYPHPKPTQLSASRPSPFLQSSHHADGSSSSAYELAARKLFPRRLSHGPSTHLHHPPKSSPQSSSPCPLLTMLTARGNRRQPCLRARWCSRTNSSRCGLACTKVGGLGSQPRRPW
ncbi:hypothetical protein M407DRAFT_171239 [Tulasnella calospora MUT 4182]|uniref:Uncharacterized protein n=1 Tax=Tulasnella calospora MUT 4182 TaxID=1051891 RepID=A0A0C3Q3C3_9AGAM|nr:hypothetical protein M407DRAFT_171239 [Tulasnella calospora MUT 4182]